MTYVPDQGPPCFYSVVNQRSKEIKNLPSNIKSSPWDHVKVPSEGPLSSKMWPGITYSLSSVSTLLPFPQNPLYMSFTFLCPRTFSDWVNFFVLLGWRLLSSVMVPIRIENRIPGCILSGDYLWTTKNCYYYHSQVSTRVQNSRPVHTSTFSIDPTILDPGQIPVVETWNTRLRCLGRYVVLPGKGGRTMVPDKTK